jgi:hypothetical protein
MIISPMVSIMSGVGAPAGRIRPMLKVIDGGAESNQAGAAAGVARSPIDEIVREGARRMLAAALLAEVAAYIEQFADELEPTGGGWWCVMATTTSAR